MRGEKRQELGRPEQFLMRGTEGMWEAQGIRIVSHGRENPPAVPGPGGGSRRDARLECLGLSP